MGCVCGVVAPYSLSAKPPIKLFETTEAEDAEQVTITISSTSDKAGKGAEIAVPRDAKRIEPTVYTTGSSMLIEAKVQGRDVLFLVDTGASYTTLTPWFAKLIGASPPSDAPTASFQTAGGITAMPFGVMASLEFGGVTHRHVTFSMCKSCGDVDSSKRKRPIVGLLGMNVLGRYKMDMDGDKLGLFKSTRYENRRADVSPWIALDSFEPGDEAVGGEWPITLKLENKSGRDIKGATVAVRCRVATKGLSWEVEVDRMPEGRVTSLSISSKVAPSGCGQVDVDVLDAEW